tara:strand:- start:295 stop:2691 length:2397 start_codon:yes stop_codon:yes gene_type:complete
MSEEDTTFRLSEVGSPFVLISKIPIEDPYNFDIKRNVDSFVLLKTSDGTLTSFREAFAEGTGGNNTGLTIELFDPDNAFILNYIDNNMVKGFKLLLKDSKTLDYLYDAYEDIEDLNDLIFVAERDIVEEEKRLAELREGKYRVDTIASRSIKISGIESNIEDSKKIIEDSNIKKGKIRAFDIDNQFYITYGFGGSEINISPSRIFTFVGLKFLEDSSKQGAMKIEFTHNPYLNVQKMEDKAAAVGLLSEKTLEKTSPGTKIVMLSGRKGNLLGRLYTKQVKIANLFEVEGINFSGIEMDSLVTMLEDTLQTFLVKRNPTSSIPAVFLSPEIRDALKAIMSKAENEATLRNSGAWYQGIDQVAYQQKNARYLVLFDILKRAGFEVCMIDATNEFTPEGVLYNEWLLSILIDDKSTSIYQVKKIIKNLYNELQIVRGSEIVAIPLNRKDHIDKLVNYLELTNPNDSPLLLVGDGLFIGGVIFKMPFDENTNIRNLFSFGSIPDEECNIFKFLKNVEVKDQSYATYLEFLNETYVIPAKKQGMFSLPDEFAIKLPAKVFNRLSSKLPTFIANAQHSNVISFIATHERIEQSELLSNLSLLFTHTYFKSTTTADLKLVSGLSKKKEEISEEVVTRILDGMLEFDLYQSTDLKNALNFALQGATSEETREAYKTVVEAHIKNLENSPIFANHNISIHAARTYMRYLQKLANTFSSIKIKSIPMFSLSPDFWINKPALFLNKKLHSPNSTSNLNNQGTFSGMYKLLGFEHVITESECYSSFSMHRITQSVQNAFTKSSVKKVGG